MCCLSEHYFTIYVKQTVMLYSDVYKLFLNKTGRKSE